MITKQEYREGVDYLVRAFEKAGIAITEEEKSRV